MYERLEHNPVSNLVQETRTSSLPVQTCNKEVHSEGNHRSIPQSHGNWDVEVLLLRDPPSKPLDLVSIEILQAVALNRLIRALRQPQQRGPALYAYI